MALQFQDIPIPLVKGQDGSSDAALIQPPTPLKLNNGEFADRGNLRAIDGLTNLPVTSMTGETAVSDVNPSTRRLLTHKDELLLETFQGTYRQQVNGSFALAAGKNNRKRDTLRCQRMGVTSIADAQASQSDDYAGFVAEGAGIYGVDSAQLGDYTCTVWIEQYGVFPNSYSQMAWQIRHTTSDAVVGRGRVRDTVTFIVGEPRVVAFGGQFRIYAISGGDLAYLFIDPASTQNVNETMTKLTAVGTYVWMDVALSPTQVCISAALSTPAVQSFIFTQAAPTVLVGAPAVAVAGLPTPVANFYIDAGAVGVQQAFVVFYACAGSYATIRWFAVSTAAVSLGAGAQALGAVSVGRPVAFKDYAGSAANFPVLIDGSQAGGAAQNIVVTAVRYDGTTAAPGSMASAGTDYVLVREHICAGLPISVRGAAYSGTQNDGLLLPVQFASSAQNTFQVIDIARSLTAALANTQVDANFSVLRVFDAGAYFTTHLPPLVGVFLFGRVCSPVIVPNTGGLAAQFWCAKFTPNITNVTQLGQNPTNIQRNTLSYVDRLGFIEFADLTYMAGGTPLIYDGQDLCEEGFTFAPEAVSVTPAGAGGPLSAGTYNIVFVYEWYDGQGNRWQSQVGAPTAFTAVLANTYTAVVRSLRTSLKSGVQVVPYRTVAGGTIFYRDRVLGGSALPFTDAAIVSNELLYTGGVLTFAGTQSNNGLPGVKQFTVHQNRLVAVGGEFDRGFFYSKARSLRFPAEFNRASGFGLVPEVTGRVAAASSFDDKLVLFAENGLSAVFGQGPNNNWLQNGYTEPVRLQTAEGIRFDSPWVGEVADGVWYVTSTGPRMLTRGLATAEGANGLPLGDDLRGPVQSLTGACEAILVHPTKTQVIFSCFSDGLTFIYDYERGQWTQRTDDEFSRSQVAARGRRYTLSDGQVSDPEMLRYEDTASVISNAMVLETGWISLAGLMRFQRLTHLSICGTTLYKGVYGTLTMQIEVYGMEAPNTLLQTTSVVVPASSTINEPWRCEFQMVKQTDTAYKIRITATPATSKGGNFSITGLLARVGLKKGGPKLPASNRG
jgi:hypothetical protein